MSRESRDGHVIDSRQWFWFFELPGFRYDFKQKLHFFSGTFWSLHSIGLKKSFIWANEIDFRL